MNQVVTQEMLIDRATNVIGVVAGHDFDEISMHLRELDTKTVGDTRKWNDAYLTFRTHIRKLLFGAGVFEGARVGTKAQVITYATIWLIWKRSKITCTLWYFLNQLDPFVQEDLQKIIDIIKYKEPALWEIIDIRNNLTASFTSRSPILTATESLIKILKDVAIPTGGGLIWDGKTLQFIGSLKKFEESSGMFEERKKASPRELTMAYGGRQYGKSILSEINLRTFCEDMIMKGNKPNMIIMDDPMVDHWTDAFKYGIGNEVRLDGDMVTVGDYGKASKNPVDIYQDIVRKMQEINNERKLKLNGETKMATPKLVTTMTLINGSNAAHYKDSDLYAIIKGHETKIAELEAMKNQPKAALAEIKALKEDITDLVAYMDSKVSEVKVAK